MTESYEDSVGHLARAPQLPSRIASVLTSEIVQGLLKAGDRLPTEQHLAERFGVSRSVVREAIARLRSDGVVQARQGVGVFVLGIQESATLRIDAELLSDRKVFQSVFELRAILETRGAGLAAVRSSDADIAAMTAAIGRMPREQGVWGEQGVNADMDFHRAIASASGNPYIASIVRMLTVRMRESIMFLRQNMSDPASDLWSTNIKEHTTILDAIVRRSARDARGAMRVHISNAARRLGYPLHEEVLSPEEAFGG
ncbi:MAG: FadR family transcriptional regulator [Rhizobiaceae bacterium]|nr:FadR family transcriptional regulator [Rhizobiaceae bacterium]